MIGELFPTPLPLRVGVQGDDLIGGGALSGVAVPPQHEQVVRAIPSQVRDHNRGSLVILGRPVRYAAPRGPGGVGDLAVAPEVLTDAEERLVLCSRRVYLEDDEVSRSTRSESSKGHAGPLVFPGEPVRDIVPIRPVTTK